MKRFYSLLILICIFLSCERDKDIDLTTVSVVNEQIATSYTSAEVQCGFQTEATLRNVYLQYSSTSDFSEYAEVAMWEDEGKYCTYVEELQDNTIYYIRYVISNRYSSVLVDDISQFQTLEPSAPTIKIDSIGDLWDTHAKAYVTMAFDGGAPITKMGICWSTQPNVTIQDNKKEVQTKTSVFEITSLQPNTTYYIRAYAENKKGISYSEEKSFITFSLPEIQTTDITDIQLTSALLSGTLVFNGNDSAIIAGFCWSETSEATISNNHQEVALTNTLLTYRLSNLKDETQYYVRAYAQNKIGVVYGAEKSFITQSAVVPTVQTTAVTNVSYTTATVGCDIISDGGADITERGVCYSTTANPTIEDAKITGGIGAGSYTINLTNLTDSTTYYVRAYAINKKGVAYGEQGAFTTKRKKIAEVITIAATNVTYNSATIEGQIIDSGGVDIIESGVCYGISPNPTISDNNKIINIDNMSVFYCHILDLKYSTKYYVRTYVLNELGFAYGNQISFSTTPCEENGYAFVDLGLSVKWAAYNVGAETPSDKGDYFAWGETKAKSVYSWDTYKYGNREYTTDATITTLYKYNTNSALGKVDNKETLDASDDAACVNWGGKWRTPTVEEISELREQCTWTWDSINGVKGYKIVAKNGNSIFLPAAGCMYHYGLCTDDFGEYWANSICYMVTMCANGLYMSEHTINESPLAERTEGHSVRPVCP